MTLKTALFPFIEWLPEVKKTWKQDIIAGILVSIILVPQSLAYSQMAGMPAYYGLYASFIPLILASLYGSSKLLSTGPAVVISLLSLSAIGKLAPAGSTEFITYSAVLALLVGVIQFGMGLLRLGSLVHFISHSVIVGFVNAAALLIVFSQVIKILEIPVMRDQHVALTFFGLFQNPGLVNIESIIVGVLSLLILVFGKRYSKNIPLALVVIILATIYSRYSGYTGEVVGTIPAGLPSLVIPHFSMNVIRELLEPAVIVALVAYMNSISVAKTIAVKTNESISPSQELLGQGIANITAGLFGSSAVAGSLSRTALNYSSGAKTNFSSVVAGVMVAVALLFFTESLRYVPQTVLAAIIIASVLQLLDFRQIYKLWIEYKYDGWVALFSFLATLVLSPNLEQGVIIGILVSGMVYAHRAAYASVTIFRANDTKTARSKGIRLQQHLVSEKVLVVTFDHSLIFANADKVADEILNAVAREKKIKYVMFLCKGINFIDATAVEMLESLVVKLKQKKITFVMTSLKPEFSEFIKKVSLYQTVGPQNIFQKANQALANLNNR